MWEIFVANLFFILIFLIIPVIIFFVMRNNCSTCSEKKCPISLCMPILFFLIFWGSTGCIMYDKTQEISEKEYVTIQKDLEKYEFNSELAIIIADAYSNKGYVSNHEFDKFKKALKRVEADRARKNVEQLKDKINNDVNSLDIERK
jgi:hypothetical protein